MFVFQVLIIRHLGNSHLFALFLQALKLFLSLFSIILNIGTTCRFVFEVYAIYILIEIPEDDNMCCEVGKE